jgi:hypothetical protein
MGLQIFDAVVADVLAVTLVVIIWTRYTGRSVPLGPLVNFISESKLGFSIARVMK